MSGKLASICPGYLLIAFLLLFLSLSLSLSLSLPLGEAPDEPAHFNYIHFIARQGRPPVTWAERDEVGYRAKWPPLYQALVAVIVRLTETDGPDQLKMMHTDSRYLLPLDGFGGMTFLHTDDEAFPYQGIVRAWHAGRGLSVVLGVGTLVLVYLTLRRHFSAGLSLAAVCAIGLIPAFVAISAVLNDDNLLGFLAALFLWVLWPLFEAEGGAKRYFALGLVAGLALMTKYSTLFLPLSLALLHLLLKRPIRLRQIITFALGYILVAGWWFVFVVYYFNQVRVFGLVKGIVAPFLAGGADLTTRQLATAIGVDSVYTPAINLFSLDWLTWLRNLFVTFWFPGSESQAWLWWLMLAVAALIVVGVVLGFRRQASGPARRMIITFSVGYILLFLPLPLLRFLLSQNIAETAQGRHLLFPILTPLAFLILAGLERWFRPRVSLTILFSLAAFFLLTFTCLIWPQITFAHTPYFPVKSRLDPPPDILVEARYAGQIRLLGVSLLAETRPNAIPITLVWQAEALPTLDYTLRLMVLDTQGRPAGLWQGQPVNGRFPTRAWDQGDVVYDTVWIPVLPGLQSGRYGLSVEVLDDLDQPILNEASGETVLLLDNVPSYTPVAPPDETSFTLTPRGDRLQAGDSYRYRSTVPLVMTGVTAPEAARLVGPDGEEHSPATILAGEQGSIALFSVDWRWPSGQYHLLIPDNAVGDRQLAEPAVKIFNSQRLSEPPPIQRPVEANFNDQFLLLGYDLPEDRVKQGQSFEITLYWQSLRAANTSYKVFNHLLGPDQVQYGGQDRVPQVFYSTILWNPGEVVIDSYPVPVFDNAPDGIYWLDVGLYPDGQITAPPLPLMQNGRPSGTNHIFLGPVKVGEQPPASRPAAAPRQATSFSFGETITLDGYTLDFDAAGRSLTLDLYWSPALRPPLDYTLFIHIVDSSGQVATQADAPPVSGLYPTSFWAPGEQVFDRRTISLVDLPPGAYTLRLGWYEPATGLRLPAPNNPDGFIDLDQVVLE